MGLYPVTYKLTSLPLVLSSDELDGRGRVLLPVCCCCLSGAVAKPSSFSVPPAIGVTVMSQASSSAGHTRGTNSAAPPPQLLDVVAATQLPLPAISPPLRRRGSQHAPRAPPGALTAILRSRVIACLRAEE